MPPPNNSMAHLAKQTPLWGIESCFDEKNKNFQFSIFANASKRGQRLLATSAEREHFR